MGPVGGDVMVSFVVEFLDNHVKGLVSFREVESRSGAGAFSRGATGGNVETVEGAGLVFGGDSEAEGDQGIAGRELVMLPKESFLEVGFSGTGGASSVL